MPTVAPVGLSLSMCIARNATVGSRVSILSLPSLGSTPLREFLDTVQQLKHTIIHFLCAMDLLDPVDYLLFRVNARVS